jgi:hypothetical protein
MVRRQPRSGGEQVAVAETGVRRPSATHPCLMGVDASPAPAPHNQVGVLPGTVCGGKRVLGRPLTSVGAAPL